MTTYVTKDVYEKLKALADPDDIRWESHLLRRIIREWLDQQPLTTASGPEEAGVKESAELQNRISEELGGKGEKPVSRSRKNRK